MDRSANTAPQAATHAANHATMPAARATRPPPSTEPWRPSRRCTGSAARSRWAPPALICAVFLFCGVFADWLAPYGVNQINMMQRLQPPSWAHPFGTDNLGRDMLSRCLYGARLSVVIGLSAATLATAVSVLLGILSGYRAAASTGGAAHGRCVDEFPGHGDPDRGGLGAGAGELADHPDHGAAAGHRRLAHHPQRGGVSAREHVRARGAVDGRVDPRILWRHVLPNVMPPVIVLFTTRVGTAIGRVRAVLPRHGRAAAGTDRGGMLSGNGRTFMFEGPWLALAPGICLTVVVYAINVFGDALRDLIDPRMRGSR